MSGIAVTAESNPPTSTTRLAAEPFADRQASELLQALRAPKGVESVSVGVPEDRPDSAADGSVADDDSARRRATPRSRLSA